jgi:hypothetical protein
MPVYSSGDEIDRCFYFYIDSYGLVDRHRFIAEADPTFLFVAEPDPNLQ